MKDLRDKERFRRVIYSVPSLVVIAFISFVLARGAIRIVLKEEGSRNRVEDLRGQITAMALREETLKKNISRLQTREGVESEIREKFSVVPEGEYLAVIIDNKKNATSSDDTGIPWYKKVFNVIMR